MILIKEGHDASHPCRHFVQQQSALSGKVVTNSKQSSITMTGCQVNAQAGISEWLAHGPYHDWKLQGYRCVMGTYVPKHEA
jgi:hypothetical protein